ncbi:MAG: tRNA (adenosine(37)-N6)-threonylcarbamoyltransferase complex ATPase subunit type 1 TsaE [Candidatus Cloacimonadota bacterium]|nr:MAG: tRNA (adenosine(37)-N6)-threonylcarbamoyltransferase complex ATPase subunit type 1 TsaE [Candidatus Cloacimonadota bacterium]PIE78579.1 MAG: tRNA (adenosine(37)-N6)-threonylcarbamoyltransferase complex ATPase subunit type 1 TsaE [Candidatus Delongbacteria bacterium]
MKEKDSYFISNSVEETREIAKKFGESLVGGDVVLYKGDVGAGKTLFTQGVCLAFEVDDYVNSPSYIIVNTYSSKKYTIYHYDLYRIGSIDELTELGYYEFVGKSGTISLIEWSELLENEKPKSYYEVDIDIIDSSKRGIRIRKF